VTVDVIRLVRDADDTSKDGPEVAVAWRPGQLASLSAALQVARDADCVLLQHEFGIFGGPDGDEVLRFVHECDSPIVTVLHTVLEHPTYLQRRIIESVGAASAHVVVQSATARDLLLAGFSVDARKISTIPHGAHLNLAPPVPASSRFATLPRREFGRDPRRPATVLTWGLLGPGKGIEHAIRAVRVLADRGIDVGYVVAGTKHPNVRASQGEAYRDGLVALAEELGVSDRVRLDDAYRTWDELLALIRSCDIVLIPYDSTSQATSGVLVDGLASGKPIVATRFPHAVEALRDGSGITVPHGDPSGMADALGRLVADDRLRATMAACAATQAVTLAWPAVGARYFELISGQQDEQITA
jgi:glycosyltransferase involved in cell wall biosynthesis